MDAVIWYTNSAPYSGYIAVTSLHGPSGAVPGPGQVIISDYNGSKIAYYIQSIQGDGSGYVAVLESYSVDLKGSTGATGPAGANGTNGTNGATFTPSVSSAGVLSWTNDGGKTNPPSVDLVAAVLAALPTWTGGAY
jgi:hypothetical protein